MSEQDGPPQGMETKNAPGYVPAQTISNDHPGHGDFAGTAGYTNTPGIGDPEESKAREDSGSTEENSGSAAKTTSTKSTSTKTTGSKSS